LTKIALYYIYLMNTFKTKLKLINDNVDTLSYIRHSNDAINISTDLKMKEGNYNINNNKAVSSSKDINLSLDRFTGKGVNTSNNILNEHDNIDSLEDVNTGFAKLESCYKRRTFKKDGIIYDLLN
jgi:hypothetical protein